MDRSSIKFKKDHLRPVIVISCERFFVPGGAVAMVSECLKCLSDHYSTAFEIKALVYKKSLYPKLRGIHYVEFPKARKSFLYRLYYEYIYFRSLSKKWKPALWLSMQDSTPNVTAKKAVYIHNSFIVEPLRFKYFIQQARFFALHFLYRFVYSKNIRKNEFIIVQQHSLAERLLKTYKMESDKLIVSNPVITETNFSNSKARVSKEVRFIYPASAMVFKNYEAIVEAAHILKRKGINNFQIVVTISGEENGYTKSIKRKAKGCPIIFTGFLPKQELFQFYTNSDVLLYPSLSESWGLPLSEFKLFDKPIIAADLSYARETIRNYNKAVYFSPTDSDRLAMLMEQAILGSLSYPQNDWYCSNTFRSTRGWTEVLEVLLPTVK